MSCFDKCWFCLLEFGFLWFFFRRDFGFYGLIIKSIQFISIKTFINNTSPILSLRYKYSTIPWFFVILYFTLLTIAVIPILIFQIKIRWLLIYLHLHLIRFQKIKWIIELIIVVINVGIKVLYIACGVS